MHGSIQKQYNNTISKSKLRLKNLDGLEALKRKLLGT